MSSNDRSVIVDSYWLDAAKAQELADAECAKHSRIAQMAIKADPWESHYVFYCVTAEPKTDRKQPNASRMYFDLWTHFSIVRK